MADKDISYSDRPKYHVVNNKSGLSTGGYFNKNRARNEVDKRDNEYGAVSHHIEARYPNGKKEKVF